MSFKRNNNKKKQEWIGYLVEGVAEKEEYRALEKEHLELIQNLNDQARIYFDQLDLYTIEELRDDVQKYLNNSKEGYSQIRGKDREEYTIARFKFETFILFYTEILKRLSLDISKRETIWFPQFANCCNPCRGLYSGLYKIEGTNRQRELIFLTIKEIDEEVKKHEFNAVEYLEEIKRIAENLRDNDTMKKHFYQKMIVAVDDYCEDISAFQKFKAEFSIGVEHLINGMTQNVKEDSLPVVNLTKLQWKGNQKELGELFVMLWRKGWIEKIEKKTIKASFTKTDSIEQALKPYQDRKTKKNTFEGVFGGGHIPKFKNMNENPDRDK